MFLYAAKTSLLVGLLTTGVHSWDEGCDWGWFASSASGNHPEKCCQAVGCGWPHWSRDRKQCDYKNCDTTYGGCHNEHEGNDWCYCGSAYNRSCKMAYPGYDNSLLLIGDLTQIIKHFVNILY